MTEARPALRKVLSELEQGNQNLSRRALQEFSDLDPISLEIVLEAWPRLHPQGKRLLLDGLRDLSDENTLVSFEELARPLLADPEGHIRTRAIRLLDEVDDPKLAPALIEILRLDAELETRAEAAAALGRFVELGELEEIPGALHHQVEDALLEKANSEDELSVRRRALESLGFSGRPEVLTLIESAFRRENPDWQASALFAMGRSSDDRWGENVLSRLGDPNPAVRQAAVEAAGDLRLGAAGPLLLELLEEEEEDAVTSAAIWSLSQIGGEDARLYIQNLLDIAEQEEHIQFLEQALDNLEFTDELNRFDLMSIDSDQE
jgi:HEAT repeat protein